MSARKNQRKNEGGIAPLGGLLTLLQYDFRRTDHTGKANRVLYITNPTGIETVSPCNTLGSNYAEDEICKEASCSSGVPAGGRWYQSSSASSTYAAFPTPPRKWARITLKANNSARGIHHGSASASEPSVQFNQCIINQVTTLSDYPSVAMRELMD